MQSHWQKSGWQTPVTVLVYKKHQPTRVTLSFWLVMTETKLILSLTGRLTDKVTPRASKNLMTGCIFVILFHFPRGYNVGAHLQGKGLPPCTKWSGSVPVQLSSSTVPLGLFSLKGKGEPTPRVGGALSSSRKWFQTLLNNWFLRFLSQLWKHWSDFDAVDLLNEKGGASNRMNTRER